MKRVLIAIALVAALLLMAAPEHVSAQETCETFDQPFNIPENFPLDGDAWVITHQVNGGLVEDSLEDDGFETATSFGTDNAVTFTLTPAVPMTITHVAADILDSVNDGYLVAVTACYDEACTSSDNIILQSGDTPDDILSDVEYTGIVKLQIGLAAEGVGGVRLDNLVIDGVLEACPYRPVHEDDQVDEDSSGDLYVITTNAGVRVYAIDDAVVDTVLHNADGYFVRLLINGATPVIYSKLSATFAEIGDEIDGGCVLGYVSQAGPEAQVDTGQFAYQHNPNLGDWHDYTESLSTIPCGQEEANCINANPEMNTDEPGWLTRFNSGGSYNQGDDSLRSLVGAGMLYQPDIVADFEATYFVTVVVALQPPATDGEIRVWFAGTETRLPIHTVGPEFVTITTLGFSTGFAGPSEFRIYNANSNSPTVRITFACLHLGDAIIAPPRCYFEDNGLSDDSFETEGGATHGAGLVGTGQYTIPVGGVIRSPVNLAAFVDADTDFTLFIQGSGSGGAGELTASIVDPDTDDELAAIGEYTYLPLVPTNPSNTFTVDASDTLDGDLYIENTGSQTVIVESVCLTSNAGVWPGYDNSDAANHDLLPTNCEECAIPESLVDVVAWLNWLGCILRYLIFCLLYTLVNNIWATASAILSGVGLFGLWLGRAISLIATWALGAGGRLLATLLSSLIPIVNAVLAWLFAQPFFRTFLDAISIVGLWIAAVWSYIGLMLDFIVTVFNYGVAILSIIANTYSAFYTALNSPASYHIIPDCSDTGAPLYHLCLVFDILIFFFEQVPMALVFMGLLAVLIMLAQFGRVLDLIGTIADAL